MKPGTILKINNPITSMLGMLLSPDLLYTANNVIYWIHPRELVTATGREHDTFMEVISKTGVLGWAKKECLKKV